MNFVVKWLDLSGTEENPAFSKIAWYVILASALFTGKFDLGFAILLGAMAFGRSAVMGFLAAYKGKA